MAQIYNTAKQDSGAQLCSVIATTVPLQQQYKLLLNYKMEVPPLSNFLHQIFHANMFFLHHLYLKGVPNVSL